MRLRGLAEEPLHKLVGEAAWRGIRSMRQLNFNRAGQVSACPIRFHPIGYYQDLDCDRSHKAILAYADAILRGEYPLMGYGSPHLGVNPDWHTDWVSGKVLAARALGKDCCRPPRRIRCQGSVGTLPLAICAGRRSGTRADQRWKIPGGGEEFANRLGDAQPDRNGSELDHRDGGSSTRD